MQGAIASSAFMALRWVTHRCCGQRVAVLASSVSTVHRCQNVSRKSFFWEGIHFPGIGGLNDPLFLRTWLPRWDTTSLVETRGSGASVTGGILIPDTFVYQRSEVFLQTPSLCVSGCG